MHGRVCWCCCVASRYYNEVSTSGRLGHSSRPLVEGAASATGKPLPIRVMSVVSTAPEAQCILFPFHQHLTLYFEENDSFRQISATLALLAYALITFSVYRISP